MCPADRPAANYIARCFTVIFRLLVLLFLVLGVVYDLALNVVKYRSAGNPTPENLADVYDPETYAKWKRYSAEKCRLAIIKTACVFVCDFVLLCTNVYAAFAALIPQSDLWQLWSAVLLICAVSTVFSIIFRYIDTMVIEQKYGFNRSNMKTFVFDCLRSALLELALAALLTWLVAWLYSTMGGYMILLFAGVMLCISLISSFLYPFLSRIGNKFVPLEEGELKDRLMELLTRHGYRVRAIEVMDASRRTTKANAYFTGFGKTKTIVLFDNLINTMTPDEICAIFAHELGHGLNKDTLKKGILSFFSNLVLGVVAWLAVYFVGLHTAFGFEYVNFGFAYILMGIGLNLVLPLMSLATNAHSRHCEYRADRQAVREGYGPALISGLKKLSRGNFSHLAPSRLNVVLEYSHPPMSQRIEAIEKELNQ